MKMLGVGQGTHDHDPLGPAVSGGMINFDLIIYLVS